MTKLTCIDRRRAPRDNPLQDLLWSAFREKQFEAEFADGRARDVIRDRGLRERVAQASAFRAYRESI